MHREAYAPKIIIKQVMIKYLCPGTQLAETEILLLLGCILRKFEIGLKENHPPLNMVFKTSLCPDSDIQITLKPRMVGDDWE